jgi:hypothetical protein
MGIRSVAVVCDRRDLLVNEASDGTRRVPLQDLFQNLQSVLIREICVKGFQSGLFAYYAWFAVKISTPKPRLQLVQLL